jgi:isovaleryl-CoA dehydrogenase
VARACDAGLTTRFDAAGAILLASENAVKTRWRRSRRWAAPATPRTSPAERLLRDAKLYDIGAGTNEIRRFLIGRELIGA